MLSIFVHRECGCREIGLGEDAYRYGNAVFRTFTDVEDGGRATRAEVKRSLSTFIANQDMLTRLSLHFDGVASKARLRTEDTSGSALTRKAMTDRHPNGFTRYGRGELATIA